jgi:hypothetical protein
MKKAHLIPKLLLFALAIISAFAFKPSLITQSYIDVSANPDECIAVVVDCHGNLNVCKHEVDAALPGHETIYEFASGTTCGLLLKEGH